MEHILKYFAGERVQCIAGILIAISMVVLSLYFLFQQRDVLRGIAFVSIPLSLILLVICTAVVLRTPKDIMRVTTAYQAKPQSLLTTELPRMESVMHNFIVIKRVELGLLVIGIFLTVVFRHHDLIRGVAIGLIIQGVILFMFDYFCLGEGQRLCGVFEISVAQRLR